MVLIKLMLMLYRRMKFFIIGNKLNFVNAVDRSKIGSVSLVNSTFVLRNGLSVQRIKLWKQSLDQLNISVSKSIFFNKSQIQTLERPIEPYSSKSPCRM